MATVESKSWILDILGDLEILRRTYGHPSYKQHDKHIY